MRNLFFEVTLDSSTVVDFFKQSNHWTLSVFLNRSKVNPFVADYGSFGDALNMNQVLWATEPLFTGFSGVSSHQHNCVSTDNSDNNLIRFRMTHNSFWLCLSLLVSRLWIFNNKVPGSEMSLRRKRRENVTSIALPRSTDVVHHEMIKTGWRR